MTDKLHSRIDELVSEEHLLRKGINAGDDEGSAAGRARLAELEVQLDQAWDLLRRRDAARSAGTDPASVEERPAKEVERYLQ